MSWTQLDGIAPASWPFTGRNVITSTRLYVDLSEGPLLEADNIYLGPFNVTVINRVNSFSYPGFDDGYAPCSTPGTISNNLNEGCDGGGGGGARPTAGMLYPRGDC